MLTPWKESYDLPRQHIKKQRHYFPNKGPSNQGYDFSSRHEWMWELNYKESWVQKWKILKEMGIPDHLTHLLRNLYAGQEATVRTGHGPTDWSQIGKGVHQGCILSPCLLSVYAEYIMRNAGLEEHKLELALLGEISITSYMQMTTPLWQKMKRN